MIVEEAKRSWRGSESSDGTPDFRGRSAQLFEISRSKPNPPSILETRWVRFGRPGVQSDAVMRLATIAAHRRDVCRHDSRLLHVLGLPRPIFFTWVTDHGTWRVA